MRRFELREGSSSKFWEITVRGTQVIVRFGRIGTDGQTKPKTHASAAAAEAEADRLVREKLGKGYAAIGAKTRPTPTPKAAPRKPAAKPTPKAAPVEASWARIDRWFAKRPQFALRLRPGAKAKDIAAAEKALGVRFPDDFKASLRIHDGQERFCSVGWLPYAQELGSLASLVTNWKGDRAFYRPEHDAESMARLDKGGRVRQVHAHPAQIPFAGSPHWDYDQLLLDFIPGPNGTAGQVIARDDCDFRFVATSFGAFLAQLASDLERGKRKPFIVE